MHNAKIPVKEYSKLTEKFNPVKFDAHAWVKMAKDAGMKYIVITAKHHDGFAMFKSEVSKYNIVDATPFGRDPIKELTDECAKQGLKIGFYYSHDKDWNEPGGSGNHWDAFQNKADRQNYYNTKVKPQLTELLTNYGPIGLIWFDAPSTISTEQAKELKNLVHKLQPDCIISGRLGGGVKTDYQSSGDHVVPAGVIHGYWEVPSTLNNTWGYKQQDNDWKKPSQIITLLFDIVNKIYLLSDTSKNELKFKQEFIKPLAQQQLKINLPQTAPDANASVVVVELKGYPVVNETPAQQADGTIFIPACLGNPVKSGKPAELTLLGRSGGVSKWTDDDISIIWEFKVETPGTYKLDLITNETGRHVNIVWQSGHVVDVECNDQKQQVIIKADKKEYNPHGIYWKKIHTFGKSITFDKPGVYTLTNNLIMRKSLFISVFVFLFGVINMVFTGCSQKPEKPEKPNIIFIFADDQCYQTIHALGNDEIITPALDKMVKEGVTFTHAYNMGAWNGAVCVASRAMLNSGCFVWRALKMEKDFKQRAEEGKMWGNLMQKAGYTTYFTGKWHVKVDPAKCFNNVVHERPGMPNQTPEGYDRPKSENDTIWEPWHKKYGGFWKGGKHWSEVLKDDALVFIDSAAKKNEPFFMYLAFNASHDPRQSPKKYVDMYPLENISVPKTYQPLYPDMEEIGCGRKLRDERLAPFPRTEYAVKVNRREYYAIITHMDDQISQILEAVKKSGEADNTYIFYTADHGLAVGNHGLMGKQNMYDHSIRPPMIVIGPDIPKDKKVDADVYLQDIMATTLELAGIEKPEYVEFNSLLSLAKGTQTKSNYDAIYGCYTMKQRMIRKDGFKLIAYPKANKVLLFDLEKDPLEINDLANNSEYSAKKKQLFDDLLKLQTDMDDELDLNPLYNNVINANQGSEYLQQ
jgi:arylsulfatase A-like enzyme